MIDPVAKNACRMVLFSMSSNNKEQSRRLVIFIFLIGHGGDTSASLWVVIAALQLGCLLLWPSPDTNPSLVL